MSKRSGGPARRPATIKPNLQKKLRATQRPIVKLTPKQAKKHGS